MDAIDRKILAVLQDNAALSVAEIGSRVGLSSTPCWKRIQRLEADGVIQKRVAIIDQDSIGLGISVFVSIETGDHSQDWLDKFAKTVTAMPEVMEFYRMAGDVDYMLRVVVPDIAGYDTLLQAADLDGAAEERHVAFRDGKDQIDDGAADSVSLTAGSQAPIADLGVWAPAAIACVVRVTVSPRILSNTSGSSPRLTRAEQSGLQL